MKLRRLEFANVGPFVGHHLIDFEQLASPLFLIDGPTGVGKSTIIDAIVYALYDRVAAESSDPARLRSLHAGPAEETYVELDFEVQDRMYRVRRSPAYLRKAKKGDGLTRNQPQVALYEFVNGEWQFREDKAQPVGAEVKRIIGLDREQFVQTVVLPQGEFAKFLHATSAERKPILQRIFHTSGFEQLEAEFARRSDVARATRSEALGVADRVRAQLENECDGDTAENAPVLATQRRERSTSLERALESAKAEEEAGAKALALAKRKNDAATALALAGQRRTRASDEVAACVKPSDERTLADLNSELAELEQQKRQLQMITEGEAAALLREEALESAIREQVSLDAREAQLIADIEFAVERAEAAVHEATAAEIQQRAAALAEGLRPGEPCPVCGSLEHPDPANAVLVTHGLAAALDTAARVRALAAQVAIDSTSEGELVKPQINAIELAELERRRSKALAEREALDIRRVSLIAEQAVWLQRREELSADLSSIDEVQEAIHVVSSAIAALTTFQAATTALARAEQELATAQTNPDLEIEATDLDTAIEASRHSAAAVARLLVEVREAKKRAERLDALLGQLRDAETAAIAVERETAPIIALASIVSGKDENLLQQPLSVFVLQTMFDDVIDAANARLAGMLNGRYELVASEESADRRRSNAGLDLTVLDHAVADERMPKTLSGGETFCVSLALALGLADTVHAYSGGVSIDTLFIDEGFGSLDPSTLEDVMAELERLGQDGRIVGVISHVEAMKAISERIDVRANGEVGSAISVTWA